MGGVASGCCVASSDRKEVDTVRNADASLDQKPQSVAMPEPTPSDACSQREGSVELSDCESDAFEKGIVHLNLHPKTFYPSMTVVFQKTCGSTQLVKFTQRPVGLNFGPQEHWSREVKMVAPGSHAEEAGVKNGWVVLTINGESLVGADDETIHSKFGEAVSVLSFPKHLINRRSSWDDLNCPLPSTRSPSECSVPL